MKKKGISAVVTTVLIILLSIIAILILWAAVGPMIRSTSSSTGKTQCIDYSIELSSCATDTVTPTNWAATVTREGGAGNVNVSVVFSDADSSVSQTIAGMGPLDTRTVSTSKTGLTTAPVTVKAAAVLADGTVCTNVVQKACA